MAAGWIIKRNNKENGPFSSQQLKQLATTGKLKREDLIRKEPGGKFMQATAVKGLFPQEDLEIADAGDSADLVKVDISRFRDLPMEEDEDDDGSPRKRRSGAARSGGKRKKTGSKSAKGKSGKKKSKDDDWRDDPVNDLFWGGTLVFFAVGVLFYMDPDTWELPEIMITVHQYTGRFGVSAVLLLLSLIFFIPAFQKIGRLKERGKPIPWHLPALGWLLAGLLSSSEEEE